MKATFLFVTALAVACACGGCSSMTPGQMTAVQTTSDRPRAGNVYLIRGWIGIFSYGINEIGAKINAAGIRANVYQENQWSTLAEAIKEKYRGGGEHEPLVLIGHSFGADDTLKVAKELEAAKISVDLIITLDPVTPPEVPSNVRRVVNLYQSNGAWDKLPAFRGVPLKLADVGGVQPLTQLVNADVRRDRTDLLEPGTDHFNIEKKAKIHGEVLRQVLVDCPPRAQWAAAHGNGPRSPIYAAQTGTSPVVTSHAATAQTVTGQTAGAKMPAPPPATQPTRRQQAAAGRWSTD